MITILYKLFKKAIKFKKVKNWKKVVNVNKYYLD